MRIDEIILGVRTPDGPVTRRVVPNPTGVTVVSCAAQHVTAEITAQALRDTLASPDRLLSAAHIPFVRILLREGHREILIADDAAGSGRMLTEVEGRGPARTIESRSGGADQQDAALEDALARIASLAGLRDPGLLLPALTQIEHGPREGRSVDGRIIDPKEIAYKEAHDRVQFFSSRVRGVDDRMTASVVPDWIWIATGFGGVGVLATVVALLHPELRASVIPSIVILSLLGFTLYALRSFRELRTRGLLQEERRQVRTLRESARDDLRRLSQALRERGQDPDEVLMRLHNFVVPESMPAILAGERLDANTLAALEGSTRQIIVFSDDSRSIIEAILPGRVRTLDPV